MQGLYKDIFEILINKITVNVLKPAPINDMHWSCGLVELTLQEEFFFPIYVILGNDLCVPIICLRGQIGSPHSVFEQPWHVGSLDMKCFSRHYYSCDEVAVQSMWAPNAKWRGSTEQLQCKQQKICFWENSLRQRKNRWRSREKIKPNTITSSSESLMKGKMTGKQLLRVCFWSTTKCWNTDIRASWQ